ncbi:hypothetical protein FA13DRAFT_307530 [Coprinellus micaceus]|uniref:MARVEL domain-containing protein n=1 Tax=Coprinellus micaceus TaxID=71717 RepID=A0A4Y7TDX9_COPMI|nr:hypothetical protein FA13DRAFT_307530 [Coprinellus micaceus]
MAINLNRDFPIFRKYAFLLVALLSATCLGLSAFIVHNVSRDGLGILSLITSVFSLVLVVVLYLTSLKAATSTFTPIATELAFLTLVWILWLVSGALTLTRSYRWWFSNEAEALGALSLTSFSILMLYTVILGTLSASAHSRGATDVWRASAKLFDWNEGSTPGSLQI